MHRFLAICPAFALAVLLGGCFPNPDYTDLPSSAVIRKSSTLVETVSVADTAAPTPAESRAIAAALAKSGDSAVRVRVRLPKGAVVPGALEMRSRIVAMGLDPAIATVVPNAAEGAASLEFVRYTATAPSCGDMVTPNEVTSDEVRPSMAFGCATYNNLVNMVTDPADLAVPRSFGGEDGGNVARGVGRYNDDKVIPLRQTTSTAGASSK
ncbi:MAG TPA: CpaD family pilus assembly lipoprotein [Magnetospirillum sp.]|nr:CpaD family pilus assembly lipoprotein [Magnetospirillum sp.]